MRDRRSDTQGNHHPKLAGADVISFTRVLLRSVPRLRDPILRMSKRYYLRGLLARLRNQADPQPHPHCVALRSHLRILPDGGVPVCQFNTERIGNLLHEDFDDGTGRPAVRAGPGLTPAQAAGRSAK